MSLSTSGVLSGTPTTASTYTFIIQAFDSSSPTSYGAVRTYTLTVNTATVPGAPTIGTATAGDSKASVSFTAPASDGGASITGYTATSSPGNLTGTCASSPCSVTGLTNGQPYTFTVKATNSVGTGTASAASNSVTPQSSQTITFNNPNTQNFGTSPTLTATASSGLTVAFSSTTTGVCTVTSGGALTFVTAGTCTIDANQAGNGAFLAAPQVAQSFTVAAVAPSAPTIGTATAGDSQASVSFTAPASNGGSLITNYTATSSPGGLTAIGTSSPLTVDGLSNGTAYTFTVTATNSIGPGAASAASNSALPKGNQTITFNNPGTQNFGTTPTLTATANSGLTVAFSSTTTGLCTVTSGGALTFVTAGTCTIDADQAGNGAFLAAPQVAQSFTVAAVAPGAPTIGTATAGNGQASVSFTAPAFDGGANITGYTTTSSPAGLTGSCASSPCSVTGLSNGTPYTFTVTATNSVGPGAASAASNSVTPLAVPSAAPKSVTTAYNTAASINLTGSITGVDITSISTSTPAHGTVSVSGETVTYTPSSTFYGGSDSFTYTATNAAGTSTPATVTITVGDAPPSNLDYLPSVYFFTQGDSTSMTTKPSHGGGSITGCSVSPLLSAGLSIASDCIISGTPTAVAATRQYTVTASNSGGSTTATVTITVNLPAPTAGTVNATVAYGSNNNPIALNTTGNPTSVAVASAPAHGSATASGTSISYTPTAGYSGADSFTYTASNTGGTSAQATVSITVSPPVLALTPASGTLSLPYATADSQTFTASGGGAPYSYVLNGTLPVGVSFNSATGTLSGAPTQPGSFPVTVTANDSSTGTGAPFSITQNYTLQVTTPAITLAPASLSAGSIGAAYPTTSLSASGGAAPYSYAVTAGAMPAGMTLSPAGQFSGTPTAAGSFPLTVTVTDAHGQTGSQTYTLSIAAPTLTLGPATLPNAPAETAYSQIVSASGGTAPYAYAISSGSLPAGMSLNASSGTLSGTPTASGDFTFSVNATDSSSGTGAPFSVARSYTLHVVAPTVSVTPATLPAATAGTAYASTTLSASGGVAPYSYVLSGPLPAGLSFNAGTATFTGTPTETGSFAIMVTATDTHGFTGSASYTLTVATATLSLVPGSLPGATAETAYSQTLTSSGGVAPYTYALVSGALPAGLSFDPANATLSGTPTVSGTFSVGIKVTDASTGSGAPASLTKTYSLVVAAPVITLTPASLPSGQDAVAYSQALSASGGNGSYSYAVTAGALPAGMTLSGTGTLSGTPTESGSFHFTVTVSDSLNFAGSQAYTLALGIAKPVAKDDTASTAYNTTVPINLTGSITGVDITSITIGTAPTHGTLSIAGETVNYTPSATYYGGTDSFTYTATNAGGTSTPATVTITVGAPAIPTVTAKAVSTAYNTAASIDLSGSITGLDITHITIGTAPTHGTVAISGETVTYTPSPSYYGGADSFTYTATNPGGTSTPATVTITVGAPAIPTVTAKAVSTAYNTAASIDLSGSITGLDITHITIGTAPTHGTVAISGETVTYTPSPSYYGGTDAFTYTATNPGGTSTPATVTITVGAPAIPTVTTKAVSTAYNTAASIDLSGSITGVDITAVTIGTAPTHGTVSVSGETVTYTPSSSYYGGSDTFTYTATNPGGTSTPATVTITVGAPAIPTVTAKSVTTAYNTPAAIDLSGSITGVDITAVTVHIPPTHGTVSVSGETVTYTPSSTYYGGSDTFTYTATNPGGTSAPATVTITVGAPAAPIVTAKSVSTAYNTAAPIDLSGSITGVDITGVTIGTPPTHGTVVVSGETVTYTPSSTYYGGSDSFTYTATNPGGTSAPATVTITVGLPPVPLVAARNATTAYDTAAHIDLSGAITGVDITSVAIASAPSHGTVSVSGKTVTYTPSSTYYGGTDSFTYTATNPGGTSTPAAVTMTVTPLSVPTAQALSITTTTGASVQIQATAGATGPAPFTGVSVAEAPAHGHATANGEQITYTPAAGFTGTDHFTYQIANHFGSSTAATVTITVTAAGQASAPNGTVTLTTKPNTPVSTDLGHIVTGQYVSSTVLGLSPGGAGRVSISQPTTLTFTSVAGFHGLTQVTVLLTAADGHTATVDVLVLVSSQPDPSKNPDVLGLINAQTMEAQRFAQNQLDNIRQRLESLHDGNQQLFSSSLSMSLNGNPLQAPRTAGAGRLPGQSPSDGTDNPNGLATTTQPESLMTMRPGIGGAGDNMMMLPDATTPTSESAGTSGGHAPPNRGRNGLAAWIDGTAAFGSFDSYQQAAGFDADSIAINTGIDQRVGEHGLFGISLGYNHDRSTVANDGTRSIAQGYSAAIYGSFAPSAKTYIDAVFGGGGLSFDSRRRDSDDDSYLFGHRNGSQWFGSLTAGYEYHHQRWMISPYGRLEWSYSALNGFAESGDVVDALAYGRQNVRTSLAVLGVRTSGMIETAHAVLVPRARLEIGHDFQGTSDTTLSYAFVPSAGSWNVLTNPYSANGNTVQAGLGLDIQLPRSLTLTTDYSFMMQPHSHSQAIRFGLNKKF